MQFRLIDVSATEHQPRYREADPVYSNSYSTPHTQIISAPANIISSRGSMFSANAAMGRNSLLPSLLSAKDKNEVRKVFVKNIADDIPDSFIESLLRVRKIR